MNSWISNWTKWHNFDLGYISYSTSQIAGVTTFWNFHKRQLQRRLKLKEKLQTGHWRMSSWEETGVQDSWEFFCDSKSTIPGLSRRCALHWSHRFILAPGLERNIFDEYFTLAGPKNLSILWLVLSKQIWTPEGSSILFVRLKLVGGDLIQTTKPPSHPYWMSS